MTSSGSIFNPKQQKAGLRQTRIAMAQQTLHVAIVGVCRCHLYSSLIAALNLPHNLQKLDPL
jgi:hypothetical protein